jgi:hypothetical protein
MRRLVVLLMLLCGAVYAVAGSSDLPGSSQTIQEQFQFLQWSGGDWTNGYPYYIAPVNGPNSLIYAVMCDDYMHGGQPGDIWTANVSNLGTQNLSTDRFNNLAGPNALYPLRLYDEAGWILLQTPTESPTEWKAMNYAVWHLFDPAAPLFGDASTWLNNAYQQFLIGFPGTDFNKVYVVTPVDQHDPDPNSMQEFMYIGQDPSGGGGSDTPASQSTPEPGTLLLVGTGALAMLRKKFLS